MSHRRPEDPRQGVLENVLRSALRRAVDSIEPAADGLERINATIAARQPAQLPRWRTAAPVVIIWSLLVRWRTAAPVVIIWALLRRLEPAVIWIRYAAGVVADRFRPESERAGALGWLGWLRPAAAVATTLFVVAGASWAIAALPQLTSQARSTHQIHTPPGGGGGGGSPAASSKSSLNSSPGGATGPGHGTSSSPRPRCTSRTPSVSPSPSRSPSGSPSRSPSPTTSPSPSSSPSPSPSPTPTGTTTSSTSSASPTTAAPASPGSQAVARAVSVASKAPKTQPSASRCG